MDTPARSVLAIVISGVIPAGHAIRRRSDANISCVDMRWVGYCIHASMILFMGQLAFMFRRLCTSFCYVRTADIDAQNVVDKPRLHIGETNVLGDAARLHRCIPNRSCGQVSVM
jgi:hypothetical protein